jgi:hypothetical protein
MKKHILLALSLTVIASALPGCRNRKNETTQEIIVEHDNDTATMLELDKTVFEADDAKATIIRIKG